MCTGDGAGAVIPAGSKLGSGAGAEKAQNSWARLFATIITLINVCNQFYIFFISATAQPFTVMFSSDNFEGQHGKNQLKKYFEITLGSWKVFFLVP